MNPHPHNTTSRILSNGTRIHPGSDLSFTIAAENNNPTSGAHWREAIKNNPGGDMPKHNPTEWEEIVELLRQATLSV